MEKFPALRGALITDKLYQNLMYAVSLDSPLDMVYGINHAWRGTQFKAQISLAFNGFIVQDHLKTYELRKQTSNKKNRELAVVDLDV